jgi:mono/diheme cytochrome c family protein
MRRALLLLAGLALLAAWWLSRPLPLATVPSHPADLVNGERLFLAGGCASCHATPDAEDPRLLGGGLELPSPVGVFLVPNISPHPQRGIGAWSALDFLNAMQRGLAPDGRHLYPAFPYPSYARMQPQDVLDLWAYLLSLPPVDSEVAQHELRFPFMLRRGIGLWKRLHLDPAPVVALAGDDPQLERGRYLVEGAGHCGECHTPRDLTQGLRLDRWLAGAANPEGEGRVPDLSPHADGLGDWSAADIEYYLESGVDPDYDVVGGSMVAVQENMARLPAADRAAIAAYLKALPTL